MRLTAQGIIHGDLKPQNVLIYGPHQPTKGDDDSELDEYVAKVADFGYSTFIEAHRGEPSADCVELPWSPPWNAPEVNIDNHVFTYPEARATDMYSLGLICLWFLFLQPAYSTANVQVVYDLMRSMKEAGKVKELAANHVDNSTSMNLSTRLTMGAFFHWTLADDPRDRRGDLQDFLNRLNEHITEMHSFRIPTIIDLSVIPNRFFTV